MLKKLLVSIALLAASMSAFSTPIYIDHEGESYWTNVTMELDFMDLSLTASMSYEDVASGFSQGGAFEGWRFATNEESRAMYGEFATGSAVQGWDVGHKQNADLFFALFGGPASAYSGNWDATAKTATNYINWNMIYDVERKAAHVAANETDGWFYTDVYGFSGNYMYSGPSEVTVALLTRSSDPVTPTANATSVSEPSALVILIAGIAGLVLRRRVA